MKKKESMSLKEWPLRNTLPVTKINYQIPVSFLIIFKENNGRKS